MSEDTYELAVVCDNCDFKGLAKIPRGTMVKEAKCPKCGVVSLRKALPGEVSLPPSSH
jgi:DNA-directed RNA polymerase subunit RPC12/RpoP